MNKLIPLSAAIALALGTATVFAETQIARGETSSSQSFDQVDTNKDGQISRAEASTAGLALDWTGADSNGDGALDRNEYDSAVKGMSGSPGRAPGSTGGGMSQ